MGHVAHMIMKVSSTQVSPPDIDLTLFPGWHRINRNQQRQNQQAPNQSQRGGRRWRGGRRGPDSSPQELRVSVANNLHEVHMTTCHLRTWFV